MANEKDYVRDLKALEVALSDARGRVRSEIKDIEAKRALRGNGKRRPVSDHAVLRYLERMGRLDSESVRDEICGLMENATHFAKCDGLWHAETGMVFITEGALVVTVLSKEQSEKYIGRELVAGGIAEKVDEESRPTPPTPKICIACAKEFKSMSALLAHVRDEHQDSSLQSSSP